MSTSPTQRLFGRLAAVGAVAACALAAAGAAAARPAPAPPPVPGPTIVIGTDTGGFVWVSVDNH